MGLDKPVVRPTGGLQPWRYGFYTLVMKAVNHKTVTPHTRANTAC